MDIAIRYGAGRYPGLEVVTLIVPGFNDSHVHFVTAPFNTGSIDFHEALGFELERVLEDYAGPGENRLLFVKHLT